MKWRWVTTQTATEMTQNQLLIFFLQCIHNYSHVHISPLRWSQTCTVQTLGLLQPHQPSVWQRVLPNRFSWNSNEVLLKLLYQKTYLVTFLALRRRSWSGWSSFCRTTFSATIIHYSKNCTHTLCAPFTAGPLQKSFLYPCGISTTPI